MPVEYSTVLPRWFVVGVILGGLCGIVVAGIFFLGRRLFPTTDRTTPSDGDGRRREEIRGYLTAIGERYRENATVHGQDVAFYLPERDVAITFDARAFFRIERAGSYAVLVEHELPGAHLGSRLPFETPELRTDADRDASAIGAAFAVLGLSPDATAEEIRAAYRKRVKEVHPDQGGSEEAFRRVQDAYARVREADRQSRSATS